MQWLVHAIFYISIFCVDADEREVNITDVLQKHVGNSIYTTILAKYAAVPENLLQWYLNQQPVGSNTVFDVQYDGLNALLRFKHDENQTLGTFMLKVNGTNLIDRVKLPRLPKMSGTESPVKSLFSQIMHMLGLQKIPSQPQRASEPESPISSNPYTPTTTTVHDNAQRSSTSVFSPTHSNLESNASANLTAKVLNVIDYLKHVIADGPAQPNSSSIKSDPGAQTADNLYRFSQQVPTKPYLSITKPTVPPTKQPAQPAQPNFNLLHKENADLEHKQVSTTSAQARGNPKTFNTGHLEQSQSVERWEQKTTSKLGIVTAPPSLSESVLPAPTVSKYISDQHEKKRPTFHIGGFYATAIKRLVRYSPKIPDLLKQGLQWLKEKLSISSGQNTGYKGSDSPAAKSGQPHISSSQLEIPYQKSYSDHNKNIYRNKNSYHNRNSYRNRKQKLGYNTRTSQQAKSTASPTRPIYRKTPTLSGNVKIVIKPTLIK